MTRAQKSARGAVRRHGGRKIKKREVGFLGSTVAKNLTVGWSSVGAIGPHCDIERRHSKKRLGTECFAVGVV